jgi:hypothetical protein
MGLLEIVIKVHLVYITKETNNNAAGVPQKPGYFFWASPCMFIYSPGAV